jgi:hypothetical protein
MVVTSGHLALRGGRSAQRVWGRPGLAQRNPLFELLHRQIDPVFWGAQPQAPATRDYQHWVYSVLGAMLAGWGSTLALVVWFPFRARHPWAWWCLGVGIALWCVIDTSVSLTFRVSFNVVFNLVIFLATMLPLSLTWARFFGSEEALSRDCDPHVSPMSQAERAKRRCARDKLIQDARADARGALGFICPISWSAWSRFPGSDSSWYHSRVVAHSKEDGGANRMHDESIL